MTPLRILRNAEGLLQNVPKDKLIIAEEPNLTVAHLAKGTQAGKGVVVLTATLPDGRIVLVQTTVALFVNAARCMEIYEEQSQQGSTKAPH